MEGQKVYLKVLLLGAQQQRFPAGDDVGHTGHQQEGRMVGEDVVKQPEPLVASQNLGEHGLQQRPHVQLGQTERRRSGYVEMRINPPDPLL